MLRVKVKNKPNKTEFELIFSSSLFDVNHYSALSGVNGDRTALVQHYLEHGEKEGLSPSQHFDAKLYTICNPDVTLAGVNKLAHFISFGAAEGRLPTMAAVRLAAKFLEGDAFFDLDYYVSNYEVKFHDLKPHEEQVALWRLGYNPNAYFDELFYKGMYPDVRVFNGTPAAHYLSVGKNQQRITNSNEYQDFYHLVGLNIDRRFYLANAPHLSVEADLAHHYITEGILAGLEPEPGFSNDYYLRRYPDILTNGTPAYMHYAKYGREEGRTGLPDFKAGLTIGQLEFDPLKPTLIIANHEASRTGAPLVGLNLAIELGKKYNIISILGNVRAIHADFLESSFATFVGDLDSLDGEFLFRFLRKRYGLHALLLNSVETSVLAHSATWAKVPVVALVHEFAEYTRPSSRLAELIRLVDKAIVPAALLEQSAQKETYFYCSAAAPNIEVRVQGALPWLPPSESEGAFSAEDILRYFKKSAPKKTRFVLGAGHASIRKGNDIFVQIAAEVAKVRDDVAFIWVGDGYSPMYDMGYSIWVNEMVNRMGLEDTVHFFPSQPSLTEFYAVCDLFLLSSRLDPFPNVVIDALSADKYVICFEGATGCAELFASSTENGMAVPYCDVVAAADAILARLDAPIEIGTNKTLAEEKFNFSNYASYIDTKLEEAVNSLPAIEQSAQYLLSTGVFDASYYDVSPTRSIIGERAVLDYIRGSSKGLARRNPKRGFSENLYFSKNPLEIGLSALESSLRKVSGDVTRIDTHRSVRVGGASKITKRTKPPKALLHIHAHYADEIAEIVARLNNTKMSVDIVATTTSDTNGLVVRYLLSKLKLGKVTVRVLENCGRDVGPFLTQVADLAIDGSYELVGHVHTKKSLAVGLGIGASWKNYLFDSLIGNSPGVLNDIFSLFDDDPLLGLVFPEDGNNIGWSSNLPYAEAIASKFERGLDLPTRPIFPVGNMFWARVEAIRPLWELGLTNDELPSEPVPYDGSILHAIERLTPTVCEYAGYGWATVYVDGVVR